MDKHFQSVILQSTGASAIITKNPIQELWSGYGQILRLRLESSQYPSVIVKHIKLRPASDHPRGWSGEIGHQRKLKSYRVEKHWYQNYSHLSEARIPQCLAVEVMENEVLLVLEDLDAAGFPIRHERLNWAGVEACLAWLAQFHASFLGMKPENLWPMGTYWHLATRPEELAALNDTALKEAASIIDKKLSHCRYQTFVHGDAKLANFCFSKEGDVAAVDFQYVGGGCGMKDLAYFVGSCLNEEECEAWEDRILDAYFSFLKASLNKACPKLEAEWRRLYPMAWADFHRFLKGWSPQHWKINNYSERMVQKALDSL